MRESRNIKYVSVAEMLLAKEEKLRQAEETAKQRTPQAIETAVWMVLLATLFTGIILYALYQEGIWGNP